MVRLFQKSRTKFLALTAVLACVSVVILYHSMGNGQSQPTTPKTEFQNPGISVRLVETIDAEVEIVKVKQRESLPCDPVPPLKDVGINTPDVYPTLNFKPPYRSFWDFTFERRYLKIKETWNKQPLQVSP